jgi:hypothetical protein
MKRRRDGATFLTLEYYGGKEHGYYFEHFNHKDVWGSGYIDPGYLDYKTRWS